VGEREEKRKRSERETSRHKKTNKGGALVGNIYFKNPPLATQKNKREDA
jgi:hypothetical protein